MDELWMQGARLVLGAAGTGKTTLLCRRYTDLVRAGERGVLLLVHSRRTARVLSERILRELGSSTDQVRVATWHSFALGLLRDHYRALGYEREPGLLTAPEQYALVRDLLRAPEEARHWSGLRRLTRLAGFVEEMRQFVLRAQDALLSPEELAQKAQDAGRGDLVEAARFFRRYLDHMDAPDNHVVDHANVIAQAWRLMQGEETGRRVRADSRHLLVDDYQDVTPAQEGLLRALFADSVCAAADPEGRVFGFRGASAAADETFRRAFAPVSEERLETVHRGEPARAAWRFDHLTEEAEAVARECLRMRVREGIPFGRTAIVVRRYGPTSNAIRRTLERAGVSYVVVGENRPLAGERALRPMLDLARLALGLGDREELLPGVLASPAVGLDAYEVRELRRQARIRGTTLASMLPDPPGDLPDRLRDVLARTHALCEHVRALDDEKARPDEVFWFLWSSLPSFRAIVAGGDAADLDAVEAFARAIERFSDRRPGKGFGDYVEALEGVGFGPEPWSIPEERRPDAVRLLTAHQAAGDEFDAVIVAGCTDGEFPDVAERRLMLDVRDLVASGTPFERRSARLRDERRLFGIAVSRARLRVLLTAARETTHREALVPSPFVESLGLTWETPVPDPDPLTRDEAEAWARRRALDPSVSEEERRAALDLLARLDGVRPGDWWYERDWTDPGIPLVTGELRTSYSRLDKYDNCALQYLYAVELGLDPEQTHQMQVGSWVHDVVDRCARGEVAAEEGALIAALDEWWDPSVFPSVAIEHRRRIDCEEMLRRWLAMDGDLDTLASEVDFSFPIDGAVMRGRIDRVVRLGGSMVRLIDYKTARNARSQEEVDDDLQLATYYLALRRDASLATLGQPKYLELAFLGAFYKDGFIRRGLDPTRRPTYEADAEERLVGFVHGIKEERFAPSPSADCQWCRFKILCPVWPEGDEVTL